MPSIGSITHSPPLPAPAAAPDAPSTVARQAVAAAFLAEQAVLGERGGEPGADQLLDLAVGDADQILHALVLDLELLAPGEVVGGEVAGLAGDRAGDQKAVLEVAVAHGGLPGATVRGEAVRDAVPQVARCVTRAPAVEGRRRRRRLRDDNLNENEHARSNNQLSQVGQHRVAA